jgi:hypothetical protein
MRTTVAAALLLLPLAACRTAPPVGPVENAAVGPPPPVALTDPAAWTPHPADGVSLRLSDDAGALRLDFRFTGGGYAIARREVDLALPPNYEFRFRVRGAALPNHLELKLVDAGGENVWWHVWHDVAWPGAWQTFTARKRQIQFAWGPQGGGEPSRVAALEFAVTAGQGGEGTVWIDGLELVERPVVSQTPPAPVASASSSAPGRGAALALDGDATTSWSAAAGDGRPSLTLDLGQAREFGGLTVDWAGDGHAVDYVVEARDDDREAWRELLAVAGANGGRDDLYLPESEARQLRLRTLAAAGTPAIAEITLRPLAWSATREAFFTNLAHDARRGLYPRGFVPEQVYWTVVGADFDTREGLLSEDGALEAGPGGFSLEPFLWTGGRLVTWADVTTAASLAERSLPLPRVTWTSGPWRLEVRVDPVGEPGASSLRAIYALTNTGARADSATLYLAVRPFQVDPPSQFLNLRGGTSPIHALARDGRAILVEGKARVILGEEPAAFGATTFAGGDVVAEHLEVGRLPAAEAVDDPFGAASAAASYPLALAAGQTAAVDLRLPLHESAAYDATVDPAAVWRETLGRVTLIGPPAAAEALATVEAQLGYILVNRAGPAIQPGSRSYARSWIRDGSLTGEALLRLGHAEAAVAFLEWFAPHQYDSGKIPCVVDGRGADPVPEHDSTGEFIHLVCECYRYTGDLDLLARMWPRVVAGIGYLESLLDQRRTDAYRGTEFYGILPPSISHEGYSAKPMHSYWDDFWALRGFKDAAFLAGELGAPEAAALAAARDRFAADLAASIAAAMQRHGIDYVPGCADLGDFDATSTTIALAPAAAGDLPPAGAIERTFEKYWEFFAARRDGAPWDALTPYELRALGAFVRLGWRDRASEHLAWFLAQRRPAGWRHWAEVVWQDERAAHFIGDMPHTWVGSDYIRSVLDMFCYEDRPNEALVLAAGVPESWLAQGGVTVRDLRTPYGALSYSLRREGKTVVMDIVGAVAIPAGGLVLRIPAGREVVVRSLPQHVVWTTSR